MPFLWGLEAFFIVDLVFWLVPEIAADERFRHRRFYPGTLPYAFSFPWLQVSELTDLARTEFNQRACNDTETIQQFPAFIRARMMDFKSEKPIEG